MEYSYFWLTLLHVLSGGLFIGGPCVAWMDLAWRRGSPAQRWSHQRLVLQHSLAAGVAVLAIGLLMAGFQWDQSFDRAWAVVESRWWFAFLEFGFSWGIIAAIIYMQPTWPTSRWGSWCVLGLLFLAATNSLYHFPALMVVSREIRLNPTWTPPAVPEGLVRSLLFSPAILFRWINVAIASLFMTVIWNRFVVGLQRDLAEDDRPVDSGQADAGERSLDRWLGGLIWGLLILLALTGLCMLLNMDVADTQRLLAVGEGKSNMMMLSILAAVGVGVRVLWREDRPTALSRFPEVGLILFAAAGMLVH